jgi:hypothetical protein
MVTLVLPDGLEPDDVMALERVARHLAARRTDPAAVAPPALPYGAPFRLNEDAEILTAAGACVGVAGNPNLPADDAARALGRLLAKAPELWLAAVKARPYVAAFRSSDDAAWPLLVALDLALADAAVEA